MAAALYAMENLFIILRAMLLLSRTPIAFRKSQQNIAEAEEVVETPPNRDWNGRREELRHVLLAQFDGSFFDAASCAVFSIFPLHSNCMAVENEKLCSVAKAIMLLVLLLLLLSQFPQLAKSFTFPPTFPLWRAFLRASIRSR